MIKLFNFRPILFGALSLAFGIVCAVLTTYIGVFAVILPIMIIAGIFIAAKIVYKRNYYLICGGIFIFVFFIGFALLIGKVSFSADKNAGSVQETEFTATVKSVESLGAGRYRVLLTDVKGNMLDFNGTDVFVEAAAAGLACGVKVRGNATFEKHRLNFDSLYRLSCGVVFVPIDENVELIKTENSVYYTEFIASEITRVVKKYAGDQAGVINALLLGRTDGIEESLLSRYQMAGIAHIFAVSGLHIGFFFSIFGFLFGLLKIRRWQKTVLSTIVTLFYVLVCSSVSAYRALIMCFTYGMCRSFGKKYDSLNSVFLSMFIVLCAFPTSLFGLGFILSYSAVVSLALFSGQFTKAFSFLPKKLAEFFAASLAVVLGTLPAIALSFGYASAITVFINLLFIPIVPIIYSLSLFGAILSAIFSQGNIFLSVAELSVKVISTVMTYVDFDRFILNLNGNQFLTALYAITLVLTTEKINFSLKVRRALYICLPITALTLI